MPIMRRRSTAPPRAGRRALAVLLTSFAMLAWSTSAALAHDELVGSWPGAGATVDPAPSRVQLEFSGAVQELGTAIVVTHADGATVSEGAVQVDGTTVTQPLAADLAPGTYTVAWRATSADGHPLSDAFDFTVGGDRAVTTDVVAASSRSAGDSAATPWIVAGAALVLLLAAGVAVRQLRRRS